jgi:hypothetical protein
MPRYYFNLRNDISVDDEEGVDLPDEATASERAVKYAVEMAAVGVAERRHLDVHHRIEVTNGAGELLFTVEFGDVVKIDGVASAR